MTYESKLIYLEHLAENPFIGITELIWVAKSLEIYEF